MVALAYRLPESLRSSPLPVLSTIRRNSTRLSAIPTHMGRYSETNGLRAVSRRVVSRAAFKLDYYYSEGLPPWLAPPGPFLETTQFRARDYGALQVFALPDLVSNDKPALYNVTAVLTDARTRLSTFFNPDFLQRMAVEHARGHRNYTLEIDGSDHVFSRRTTPLPRSSSRSSELVQSLQRHGREPSFV